MARVGPGLLTFRPLVGASVAAWRRSSHGLGVRRCTDHRPQLLGAARRPATRSSTTPATLAARRAGRPGPGASPSASFRMAWRRKAGRPPAVGVNWRVCLRRRPTPLYPFWRMVPCVSGGSSSTASARTTSCAPGNSALHLTWRFCLSRSAHPSPVRWSSPYRFPLPAGLGEPCSPSAATPHPPAMAPSRPAHPRWGQPCTPHAGTPFRTTSIAPTPVPSGGMSKAPSAAYAHSLRSSSGCKARFNASASTSAISLTTTSISLGVTIKSPIVGPITSSMS